MLYSLASLRYTISIILFCMNTFIAQASSTIDAPIANVWEAFTNPAMVKQWLFGTEMNVSSWSVGGSITYRGEWEGKVYEDKGTILEIIPQQKLVSTYWSAFSGLPDAPEHYQKVTYELASVGNATQVIITQEGSKTKEQAEHSEGNWKQVLISMKKLLEA